MQYKEIREHKIGPKKYKLIGIEKSQWKDFKESFFTDLQNALLHSHFVRRQNDQRRWISSVVDGTIHLPFGALFVGLDYIANKRLTSQVVSQGVATKIAKYSLLVTYNVYRTPNGLHKESVAYLSDHLDHSWCAIIPILKHHFSRYKAKFSADGHVLKTVLLFSDRCGHDVWCSPSFGYQCELADDFGISIVVNTTASGHGKWHFDRIGGNISTFVRRSLETGKVIFIKGKSVSGILCDYLTKFFSRTKKGDFERYFTATTMYHHDYIYFLPSRIV